MLRSLNHLFLRNKKSAKNSDIIPYFKNLLLPDIESILDIGCGQLWDNNSSKEDIILSCFNSNKYKILGIDKFLECIVWRKQNMCFGEYLVMDAKNILDLLPRKFDLVIAHHIIEHLTKKDGEKLLADIFQLSSKQVIIGCPDGFTDTSYAVVLHGNNFERHLSGWVLEDFKNRGFEMIRIKNVLLGSIIL